MARYIDQKARDWFYSNLPADWNKWTFRKVIRVNIKDAFYRKGRILKIKHFGSFGCFDHKDRWVDYYDIGAELKMNWWRHFIFWIQNMFNANDN